MTILNAYIVTSWSITGYLMANITIVRENITTNKNN